jgi:GMP synthase (glutamine-hydrolysing)
VVTVLVVEHEPSCPPALLGSWLEEAGGSLSVCRPWAGDVLPALADHDAWVVLGGSAGAYDDDRQPWLPEVRHRIAEASRGTGTPVLGVCLGHQLAAVAAGGRVDRDPAGQRVGLYDVGWTPAASVDPLLGDLATPRRAVQWNNDTVVELPAGATVLAALPDGAVQAARFAPAVWGIQWHPEVDRRVLTSWAEGDRDDHLERGIDQEAVLSSVDRAATELDVAWRPLAAAILRLATEGVPP